MIAVRAHRRLAAPKDRWRLTTNSAWRKSNMAKVVYRIVEHDGGWAYKSDGVFSESFPSHGAAVKAAKRAALEQGTPGETAEIQYEDENGEWRSEHVDGHDRPSVDIVE
jgi:hypothetical protein